MILWIWFWRSRALALTVALVLKGSWSWGCLLHPYSNIWWWSSALCCNLWNLYSLSRSGIAVFSRSQWCIMQLAFPNCRFALEIKQGATLFNLNYCCLHLSVLLSLRYIVVALKSSMRHYFLNGGKCIPWLIWMLSHSTWGHDVQGNIERFSCEGSFIFMLRVRKRISIRERGKLSVPISPVPEEKKQK